MDETWVPHFDPETKAKSDAMKIQGHEVNPESHVAVFWDPERILLVDFLGHVRTINGPHAADLLGKLREALPEKRRGKMPEVFLSCCTMLL